MKMEIKSQKIILTHPIYQIVGDVDITDLQQSFPYLDLQELYDIISNLDGSHLFDLFMNFPSYTSKSQKLIDKPIQNQNILSKYFQAGEKVQKTLERLQKILRLKEILEEYSQLNQTISELEMEKNTLQDLSKESIFQSKSDLLIRLEKQHQDLISEYELLQDEFQVQNTLVSQIKSQETELSENLAEIKKQQQELFKSTNVITDEIDEIDKNLNVYKEKLLNMAETSENYSRIQEKAANLENKKKPFVQEKTLLMKKSKELQNSMLSIRSQQRQLKKDIKPLLPKFNLAKSQFDQIKQQKENLESQITSLNAEVNLMMSQRNSDISHIKTKFSSIIQVENLLSQKKERLSLISNRLSEIFHTDDISTIETSIQSKYHDLITIFNNLNSEYQDLNENYSSVSMTQSLADLQLFKLLYNHFLSSISIEFIHSIKIPKPESEGNDDEVTMNNSKDPLANPGPCYIFDFHDHKGKIKIDELKRIEKALVYLSFLISLFIVKKYPYVPIFLKDIPSNLTTQKSFEKVLAYVEESIEKLQNLSELQETLKLERNQIPNLLFFTKNPYNYPNSINIEEENA